MHNPPAQLYLITASLLAGSCDNKLLPQRIRNGTKAMEQQDKQTAEDTDQETDKPPASAEMQGEEAGQDPPVITDYASL
jgi:hypothetical protein